MNTALISRLETTLAQEKASLSAIAATASKHNREMSAGEQERAKPHIAEIHALNERIAELREEDERDAAAEASIRKLGLYRNDERATSTGSRYGLQRGYVTDAATYHPESRESFFLDYYRATKEGDAQARERLDRNARERHGGQSRALSTTTGAGGEFVPPLWLEDKWIALARAGRVTTDLLQQLPMPPGTDQVNIPKVNTGTATALQGTQNTAIQQTDMTTTSVSSGVFTVAGGATISMQLAEQSPGNADEIVLGDLAADYTRQVGNMSVNSTTAAGAFNGLIVSAGGTVPYVDASPAVMGPGKLLAKIAQAKSQIETGLYRPADAIVMHPRRWDWLSVQTDNAGRAIVLPEQNGPHNASGVQLGNAAEGAIGTMLGVAVYIDPQIPINGGTGTNQDTIIVMRRDESWFWEGNLRLQAFQQTYAQNLSLYLRCYNYIAQVTRRAQAVQLIQGTGLATPTW